MGTAVDATLEPRNQLTAARLVRDRLMRLANDQRLAQSDVDFVVDAVMARAAGAFARSLDDPLYLINRLCPSRLPIEVSYSEDDEAVLRVDLVPLDPLAKPLARVNAALLLADVEAARVMPFRKLLHAEAFGAFVAVAIEQTDAAPRVRSKAYLEMDHHARLDSSSGPFAGAFADLLAAVPGLEPHLLAFDGGANPGPIRVYFECRNGLALLSLDRWLTDYGFGAVAPALLDAVCQLAGGAVVLPAGLLLALRVDGLAVELKVEITSAVLAPDACMILSRLLLARPASRAKFLRFADGLGRPALSVVSARVRSGSNFPTFNAYAPLLQSQFSTRQDRWPIS